LPAPRKYGTLWLFNVVGLRDLENIALKEEFNLLRYNSM
jgi:hypothetical protein